MCGIIGGVGNFGLAGQKMIKMMLLLDQVRGFNSTGIVCIDDDDVYSYKKAVHSTDFLEYKITNALMDDAKNKAIIGHNRAATKGAVTNSNAHPFNHGNITGVHNGTLRIQHNLEDWKDFDVDSENIFYHMSKHGAENTIKILQGAFTLVWWDELAETLSIVRNKERPMCYAYAKDGKALYYASEAWMLEVAAMRCNVKIGEVVDLPIAKLLSVDLGGTYNKYTTPINTVVSLKDIEIYKEPVVVKKHPTSVSGRNWGGGYCQSYTVDFTLDMKQMVNGIEVYFGITSKGEEVEVSNYGGYSKLEFNTNYTATTSNVDVVGGYTLYKIPASFVKAKPVVVESKKLVTWWDENISEEEALKRLDKGCAWCDEVTNLDDYQVISPYEYVCGGCKKQPEVREYIQEV